MDAVNQLPSLFSDHGLNLTPGTPVDGHLFNKTLSRLYSVMESSVVFLSWLAALR